MVFPRATVVALVSLLAGCYSKRLKTGDVVKFSGGALQQGQETVGSETEELEDSFGVPELGDLVEDAEESLEQGREAVGDNTEELEESFGVPELGDLAEDAEESSSSNSSYSRRRRNRRRGKGLPYVYVEGHKQCEDFGYAVIQDAYDCEAAARALGKPNKNGPVRAKRDTHTCGCTFHPNGNGDAGNVELWIRNPCDSHWGCGHGGYEGCFCKKIPKYVFVGESRTCEEKGLAIIETVGECEEAAKILGKRDKDGRVSEDWNEDRCGCSWHPWGNIELFKGGRGCKPRAKCNSNGYGGCFCKTKA